MPPVGRRWRNWSSTRSTPFAPSCPLTPPSRWVPTPAASAGSTSNAIVDHERAWDLRDLRLLNENIVKPALERASGVAEVASVGGLEKQYQLKIFPPLLAKTGVSLRQVITALQDVFQEVGGRTIEVTNRDYQLRGVVNGAEIDQLELIIVDRTEDGQVVQLRDIGHIQVGYDLRRGIADLDGQGEVVGGIAIMEQGQNVLAVTRALEQQFEQVNASLPDGLEIVPTYDRSSLIWGSLTNFAGVLAYELLVVVLVIVWGASKYARGGRTRLRAPAWHAVHGAADVGARSDHQPTLAGRSGDRHR